MFIVFVFSLFAIFPPDLRLSTRWLFLFIHCVISIEFIFVSQGIICIMKHKIHKLLSRLKCFQGKLECSTIVFFAENRLSPEEKREKK